MLRFPPYGQLSWRWLHNQTLIYSARLFYYLPSDHVVRRSVLWQPVCVKDQPGIIPSVELLVAALIRNDVRHGQELIRNSLERFKGPARNKLSIF